MVVKQHQRMGRKVRPAGSLASFRLARPLLSHLQASGLEIESLMAAERINPAAWHERDALLPQASLDRLWQQAEILTGDPCLGLHLSEKIDFRIFEHLEIETEYLCFQLLLNCPTIGEGLDRFAHSFAITHVATPVLIEEREGLVSVRFVQPPESELAPALLEFLVTNLIRAIRDLAEQPVLPKEVRFTRDQPSSAAEYERVLGAPVRFEADMNGFVLSAEQRALRLRGHKPHLRKRLEESVALRLASMQTQSLVEQVRAVLGSSLTGHTPTVAQTAQALGFSARTLARRLQEEGTTHHELLDDVRAAIAQRLLTEERLPVADIATRLGFSEPRAFQRAFQRWFGQSPTNFRNAG